jgi:WD40 repeat protein
MKQITLAILLTLNFFLLSLFASIGHTRDIPLICFSKDGKYALTGGGDYKVKLWEIASEKEI